MTRVAVTGRGPRQRWVHRVDWSFSLTIVVRAPVRAFDVAQFFDGGPSRCQARLRHHKPPSQTWKTFLENHVSDLVSVDFLTVPTATFRILYVFLILHHERRQVLHFNVTDHPTAEWSAQQIIEAFPFDSAPRYLLRDRDSIYGERFRSRVANIGIKEVLTAPRSPWQSPYVERIIGSIRRECLNHVIVVNERHLQQLLRSYFVYYHRIRTHLSLNKQCPVPRRVGDLTEGKVVAIPHVGGLHHEYRIAA